MPFSVGLSAEVIKYDKQVKEVKDVPKLVLTELLNLGDHSAMTSRHHNLLMWDHQLVRCSMREVFSLTPCFVSVQGKPPVFPQRFIEKINLAEVLLQILPLSGRATSLCRIQILADFQQIQ